MCSLPSAFPTTQRKILIVKQTLISPLVAEAFGAGHKGQISRITGQGLWLSLFLSVPTMLLMKHFDIILSQFGQAETTVSLANSYLDIMLWGLFPALGFAMLRGAVSGLAQTRPAMVIVIFGTLFNVIGN